MLGIAGERVLVLVGEAKEKTESGIILPEQAKERPVSGKVVATGAVYDVGINDTVIFSKYAGIDIEHDGVKYVILNKFDLLAKVVNNEILVVGERMLIEIDEPEEKVKVGGVELFRPADYQYHRQAAIYGTIRQTPTKFDAFEVGDRVVVTQNLGAEITINGKEHRLVKPIDILAKVEA